MNRKLQFDNRLSFEYIRKKARLNIEPAKLKNSVDFALQAMK